MRENSWHGADVHACKRASAVNVMAKPQAHGWSDGMRDLPSTPMAVRGGMDVGCPQSRSMQGPLHKRCLEWTAQADLHPCWAIHSGVTLRDAKLEDTPKKHAALFTILAGPLARLRLLPRHILWAPTRSAWRPSTPSKPCLA